MMCLFFLRMYNQKKEKRYSMSEIHIAYYGHSCFKVSYQSHSIVFDPYEDGSVPGLKLPDKIEADAVSCSHQHADHNAEHLIHLTGRGLPFDGKKIPVPHDDANGAKRGMSDITFVKLGHAVLAHLGDIGRMPTVEEYEELKKADIIMIPVGGYFTIDAKQSAVILHKLPAKLRILMHFRKGNRGYEVLEDLADIHREIPELQELKDTGISFDEDAVPEETVTLEPIQ